MIDRRRPDDMERYVLDHLDEALSRGYIKVYVQPVVRTLTRQICGMEALSRWEDPEYGMLMPVEYIGILEKHRRIHHLDTYVLNKVCENYSTIVAYTDVPVSINLSRLDYELCDIFEIVENAVLTNKMPRSSLCIEITESVLASNEALMSQYIERFHEAGYGVWMDDFGSGYSSLNVLKDYMFDELKIDMRFLSNFHVRSRTILSSIVNMAKQISVQTLAEGVETEEQFDFLRNIGCEKVQGFLFGQPMPYEACVKRMRESGLKWESPKMRGYYDAIGYLNVLSANPFKLGSDPSGPVTGRDLNSIPLAILELSSNSVAMLFANQAFETTAPALDWPLLSNSGTGVNYIPLERITQRMQHLLEETRINGKSSLFFVFNDEYYETRTSRLAQLDRSCAILVNVTNLSRIAALDQQKLLDDGLRSLYSVYDQVLLINLNEMTVLSLHQSNDADHRLTAGTLQTRIEEYANELLFPDDRERFITFMCPDTLDERTLLNGGISIHLRILSFHGAYTWKCFHLVRIRENIYYLLIRSAEAEVRELQAAYRNETHSQDALTAELLWDNVVKNSDLKFFWKDSERRFVGASRSFLDYYEFSSQADIVGKTDEDMGWHIHPDHYRSEEWKVLHEGITSRQVTGNCLVQGENRRIIATKMPLYNTDGKIVGLIGTFSQSDSPLSGNASTQSRSDTLTGLLNSRGITEDLHAYIDEYQLRGQDFARIEVSIDDFAKINTRYGYDFGDAVIRETGRMLLKCCGNTATVGRFSGCSYTVIRQFEHPSELDELILKIRQIAVDLRQVDGVPFRLYLSVGMALYSETESLDGMAAQAEMRCLTDDVEGISQQQLIENGGRIFKMFDELPVAYAVYKVIERNGKVDAIVLYANRLFLQRTKTSPENLIGRRVNSFFGAVPEEWLPLAVQAGLEGKTVSGELHVLPLNLTISITAHPVIGPGFCAFTFQKVT